MSQPYLPAKGSILLESVRVQDVLVALHRRIACPEPRLCLVALVLVGTHSAQSAEPEVRALQSGAAWRNVKSRR